MAENAARLAALGPEGIDLNFGCPAKTVNRHGGGAGPCTCASQESIAAVVAAVPRRARSAARVRQDAPGL